MMEEELIDHQGAESESLSRLRVIKPAIQQRKAEDIVACKLSFAEEFMFA
jgi:hypothetical protein